MKIIFFIAGILLLLNSSMAQHLLTGTVTSNGVTLPGATIQIVNTQYGTASDANGNFSFKLPTGSYQLKVSYVGYVTLFKNFAILNNDEKLDIQMKSHVIEMSALEVLAVRVTENSAMAVSVVDSKTISQNNLGTDLPYVLEQTPSTVVTSDAGNGVGYSGIRIRGSDPTRVNVTINGIPVNDSESQGVYWVDFPDLASSTNSIQIQRGAGASTNGAGAFGGSVSILTQNESPKAHAEISNSYGSFNTHKHTLKLGTGNLYAGKTRDNFFTCDARLSWIGSDGYIDRAFSDLKSFYISSSYNGKKSNIRFVAFSGKEHTYQAWYGVPKDSLETNRQFNHYTYKNETDNYVQSNYQLLYNFKLNSKIQGNVSLHYTKGAGYYEQYKSDESFSDYGLDNILIGNDTISSTDLIRRLWLDNDFYGAVYTLNYNPNGKLNFTLGGGWNHYYGNHFGEIVWAEYASNSNNEYQYYQDDANKSDFNTFLKTNYWLKSKINIFADVQVRNVQYSFKGYDGNLNLLDQKANLTFFNPKAGATFYLPQNNVVYASFSIANKEPNRDDFVSSSTHTRPRPERLMDLELGYKVSTVKFSAGLNFYNMMYKDQLVLTGKINDVGAYTRQNISESYRRGVEIEGGWNINKTVNFTFNTTLSQNRISNYVEYIDNYDTWGQDSIVYAQTDIAFSPKLIASGTLNFKLVSSGSRMFFMMQRSRPHIEFLFSIITKYVGRQYIDNTSSSERLLDGYMVCDGRLSYKVTSDKSDRFISVNFMLRNFMNKLYSSNAWSYRYIASGTNYTDLGYYPQAGINYLVGLTIGF